MSIQHYLKAIGRGRYGARALTREQAADLLGNILGGRASDLQIGAFCLAMRVKGETPAELAGFLDAARQHLNWIAESSRRPTVVLPSYNGARRLPVLTPLLAWLLVQQGVRVIVHGMPREPGRVTSTEVLQALGIPLCYEVAEVRDDVVNVVPPHVLSPPLRRLLEVRRAVGVRNSAHSLVKLLNPCRGRALVVSSYTHPEYRAAMTETCELIGADAMLLRGIGGEAVADARRHQAIDVFLQGQRQRWQEPQSSTVARLPDWPVDISAPATARYIQEVVAGQRPLPPPIASQLEQIHRALAAMAGSTAPALAVAPPASCPMPEPPIDPSTHAE